MFPAESTARGERMWEPSASGPTRSGLGQAVQAPPSIEHWKVAWASLELKEKVEAEFRVSAGGWAVMLVMSLVVLMVQLQLCAAPGVSVLPAGSVAFTTKVWLPSARLPRSSGE